MFCPTKMVSYRDIICCFQEKKINNYCSSDYCCFHLSVTMLQKYITYFKHGMLRCQSFEV